MASAKEPNPKDRSLGEHSEKQRGTPPSPAQMLAQLAANAGQGIRFEDDHEIARGGMGAILRTWDPELRRELARKILLTQSDAAGTRRPASEADELLISRFLDEAQITGQLDHPGIVPVHNLGIDDQGHLYFTMRLVRGDDLEHVFSALKSGKSDWSRTRVLQILLKVCEAMAYAHAKGIVHRDMKPANVMVGRFGEVYVMDWGLARVLDREDTHDLRIKSEAAPPVSMIHTDRDRVRQTDSSSPLITMDGDVVGTPAYMAPEQANGELHLVDRRSDVYSIGAMLYHLIAGHAPYQDRSGQQDNLSTWKAARSGPPKSLKLAAPSAPAELVAICDKAMARDPRDRYADTQELEQDLRFYLEGRVVRAYEAGAFAQMRKWVLRNKATAAATAAAVALALGGLATTSYIEARANTELEEKNEELGIASLDLAAARDNALASAQEAQEQRGQMAALAEQNESRAQEALRERDASERLVHFLTDLFGSSAPENARGEDLRVREVLERGARDLILLDDEPLLAARMREAMGRSYSSLGLYAEAGPLLERALADRRTGLPEPHPDTAASMDDLGFLRYRQADYEAARTLLEEALETRIACLGGAAAEVLETRRHLALIAHKQGRLDDARLVLEEGLDAHGKAETPDELEVLKTQAELGAVLVQMGRLRDARPLLERTYEGRLAILGQNHPDTLLSENDLAFLLSKSGELREARELYEDCLEWEVEVNGLKHPDTLIVQNNLAALLFEMGEADSALALYTEALESARQGLGQAHPTTLGILNGLATVELGQGEPESAASHFEEALSGLLSAFSADHPNVRVLRDNLVVVYRRLNRPTDALRHARAILSILGEEDSSRPRTEALVKELAREVAQKE